MSLKMMKLLLAVSVISVALLGGTTAIRCWTHRCSGKDCSMTPTTSVECHQTVQTCEYMSMSAPGRPLLTVRNACGKPGDLSPVSGDDCRSTTTTATTITTCICGTSLCKAPFQ